VAPDTMRVRLHLRLIRVLEVLVDDVDRLVVRVASTRPSSLCPWCGFRCWAVHDTRDRRVRDLPISGRRVSLIWQRRRFACANCGERHLEVHPAFEGRLTVRLARQLVADARVMPIRAVARRHQVAWSTVMGLVTDWAELIAAHRRRARCRVLLVDETAMRRRHRYVTVLQDGETGALLGVVPHRNTQALHGFLAAQGRRWCRGVEVVVTDGSAAYRAAIDADLGHAIHVLDRFHVVRWFAAGLTAVRREVQRRDGQHPVFDPAVFGARFALLRRADTLEPEALTRLVPVLEAHPRLAAAWQALQTLHGAYLAEDKTQALEAIIAFCDLVDSGNLPEFDGIIHALQHWGDQIIAFHHPRARRISNGRLEGTNNKLQVLRRVAHGFTNTTNFAARAILACGPVPSSP
jgi:transposase